MLQRLLVQARRGYGGMLRPGKAKGRGLAGCMALTKYASIRAEKRKHIELLKAKKEVNDERVRAKKQRAIDAATEAEKAVEHDILRNAAAARQAAEAGDDAAGAAAGGDATDGDGVVTGADGAEAPAGLLAMADAF